MNASKKDPYVSLLASNRRFGHIGYLRSLIHEAQGQSTVEYALVVSGFLVVFLAMGLMHHAISSGLFVEHALMSASHVITNVPDGVLRDVFLV